MWPEPGPSRDGAAAAAQLLRAAGIACPDPTAPAAPTGAEPARPCPSTLVSLADLWPALGPAARRAALRSAGTLVRRLPELELPGFGAVDSPLPGPQPLQWALAHELGVRGFPAVAAALPEALGTVEGLLESIPEVSTRAAPRARYAHGDLRLGAFLCAPEPRVPAVLGLAHPGRPGGWPAESDLARLQLAHGRLGQPLHGGWFDQFLQGYGAAPDPVLLAFFRAVHRLRLLLARRADADGALTEDEAAGSALRSWLDDAAADMETVHAAYEARMRALAREASLPPVEAAALLPRAGRRNPRRPARA